MHSPSFLEVSRSFSRSSGQAFLAHRSRGRLGQRSRSRHQRKASRPRAAQPATFSWQTLFGKGLVGGARRAVSGFGASNSEGYRPPQSPERRQRGTRAAVHAGPGAERPGAGRRGRRGPRRAAAPARLPAPSTCRRARARRQPMAAGQDMMSEGL